MPAVGLLAVAAVAAAVSRRGEGQTLVSASKALTGVVAVGTDGTLKRTAISRINVAPCAISAPTRRSFSAALVV